MAADERNLSTVKRGATAGSGSGGRPAIDTVPGGPTEPLRVAQLVTTMARGGAQLTVLESLTADPTRFAMTVLAGGDRPDDGDFWDDHRLQAAEVVEMPALRRRVSPGHDLVALVRLVRWLRSERPNVLHTHSTKAGVLGRVAASIAGVPVVHTVHGWAGPLYSDRVLIRRGVALLERLLARITDTLVVVGNGDRERGLDLGIGRRSQYRVIRSGVHLPDPGAGVRANAPGARSSLALADDALVIGMVARFADQKDHRTALRAFAALTADHPEAVLVFIGNGPTRPDVENLAVDLDLRGSVVFAGHRSDAAELAAAFDIGLLTSHWEGVPRSLVESAAAAVPLVATDVGGVADIVVEGTTGFLVPVGEVAVTIDRLKRLLDDPGLRVEMGAAAAKQAEMFSVDRMRLDLQDLWRTVANERATSRTVTPGP